MTSPGKLVALTFDGAPTPPYTGRVLDVLAAHDVVATFFLRGSNVHIYPDEACDIALAGHEIANHTFSHFPLPGLSNEQVRDEITRTREVIERVIGVTTTLVRPPWGERDARSRKLADETGHRIILWDHEVFDYDFPGAQVIIERLLEGIKPSCVVVLHDFVPELAAALHRVIPKLKERGYRFVTVSELMATRDLDGLLEPKQA